MRCSLIPARGGSKRVPRKNVRLLNGIPLIAYSIRHALESSSEFVVVTTDDDEIADVSREAGANVIMRPADLAGDKSPTIDAVVHAIEHLKNEGHECEFVAILQPTCPIRPTGMITEAFDLLESTGCDSVATYRRMGFYHPNRMKRVLADNKTEPYCEDEIEGIGVSELPHAFQRDGYLYACKTEMPMQHGTLFGSDHRAMVVPGDQITNIDDENDWKLAEILMQDYLA